MSIAITIFLTALVVLALAGYAFIADLAGDWGWLWHRK